MREEGAVQVFYPWGTPRTEPILGAVGELQFEVAKYRLESEYNVKTHVRDSAVSRSRCDVDGEREQLGERAHAVQRASSSRIGTAAPVALFESEWSVRLAQEWNPATDALRRFPPRVTRRLVASSELVE